MINANIIITILNNLRKYKLFSKNKQTTRKVSGEQSSRDLVKLDVSIFGNLKRSFFTKVFIATLLERRLDSIGRNYTRLFSPCTLYDVYNSPQTLNQPFLVFCQ